MRALVWSVLAAGVVAAAVTPPGAAAQSRRAPRGRAHMEGRGGEPKAWLGLSLIGAQPQGDFGRVVDDAAGGALELTVPLARDGQLRLHAEAGALIYGHEHRSMCAPAPIGCRIDFDLSTDNAIFFGGVGPELALLGNVSPYANATIGVSDFRTFSSLGSDGGESFANTSHYHDDVLAGRVGGGVRAQVRHGRFPLLVDLGARYHFNGTARYLIKGDVRDLPDGRIAFDPRRSEANVLAFQLGVQVGLGRQRAAERVRVIERGRRR